MTRVDQDPPVVDLAGALTTAGHEVDVHAAGTGGSRASELDAVVSALRDRWTADPPDVVHTHRRTSGLAALLAARPLGIPVVHTHQDMANTPAALANMERAICRSTTRVVATSAADLPVLVRFGVRRSRIAVVPYGVDPARFTPEGPRAVQRSPFRLLTAASAWAEVPEALVAAVRTLPDVELVVLDGPPSVDETAARLGVADQVTRVAGHTGELPSLLRSADIVVCGPWHDRPSVLALRAMACGVAVVGTTSAGGLSDVVVHGVTGLLPAQRARTGLVRVLRALLTDHGRREAYAVAGADRVLARYTLDHVAAQLTDVYTAATDDRADRRVAAVELSAVDV
ncbi:glycosyltransferase family 4 protein [Actinosynnema sp. NPDC050436]|uniref:glycosyltransferase family 4 protein n=1 Tax=Actinosynnema sp. NPDC050436 TaxID=3155659 RepID=UPI0033EEFCF0